MASVILHASSGTYWPYRCTAYVVQLQFCFVGSRKNRKSFVKNSRETNLALCTSMLFKFSKGQPTHLFPLIMPHFFNVRILHILFWTVRYVDYGEETTVGFQLFSFPLYTSISVLFRVIVCERQLTWPQFPGEAVFLTSTTCIIRRDFLFEWTHCLSHPRGRQIVIPSSRLFPCL